MLLHHGNVLASSLAALLTLVTQQHLSITAAEAYQLVEVEQGFKKRMGINVGRFSQPYRIITVPFLPQ